jgi:hypothetical protein
MGSLADQQLLSEMVGKLPVRFREIENRDRMSEMGVVSCRYRKGHYNAAR